MDERHTLTRRSFLGIAGALPIAWAAGRALPAWAAARIPVALQLYSVRGDCKQNFDAALEQVAAMGFEGVEFAGYYNYAGKAAGLAAKLKALNLKAAGTHVRMDALRGDALKNTIDFHQAIGCRFLVVPGDAAFTDPEKSKALADEFNPVAATLKPLGMASGYHNHVNEFKKDGGQDVLGSVRRADDEGRHPAAGLRLDDGGRASTRRPTSASTRAGRGRRTSSRRSARATPARRPSSARTRWTGNRSTRPATRPAAPSGSSSNRRSTRTASPRWTARGNRSPG